MSARTHPPTKSIFMALASDENSIRGTPRWLYLSLAYYRFLRHDIGLLHVRLRPDLHGIALTSFPEWRQRAFPNYLSLKPQEIKF
jgi:hypothetical protein